MDLETEIRELMKLDADSDQFEIKCQRISNEIKDDKIDFVTFAESLGIIITSRDVYEQAIGLKILSNVLQFMPNDQLNAVQLKYLCNFYITMFKTADKLLIGLLESVESLSKQKHIFSSDVLSFVLILSDMVDNQRQEPQMRLLIQKIVIGLIRNHRKSLLEELTAEQLYLKVLKISDGESDSSCIQNLFEFFPEFLSQVPLNVDSEMNEEFFTFLWSYFPLSYPSESSGDNVTKQTIAEQLEKSILSNPNFAKNAINGCLEMLNEFNDQHRYDTLKLMKNSFSKYPVDIFIDKFEDAISVFKNDTLYGRDDRVKDMAVECFVQMLVTVKDHLAANQRLLDVFRAILKVDVYHKMGDEFKYVLKMLLAVIDMDLDLSREVSNYLVPILMEKLNQNQVDHLLVISAMLNIQKYEKKANIAFQLKCFDFLKNDVDPEIANACLYAIVATIDYYPNTLKEEFWRVLQTVLVNGSRIDETVKIDALRQLSFKNYDNELSEILLNFKEANNKFKLMDVSVHLCTYSPKFNESIIAELIFKYFTSTCSVFKYCLDLVKYLDENTETVTKILMFVISEIKVLYPDLLLEYPDCFLTINQLIYELCLKDDDAVTILLQDLLPEIEDLEFITVYDAIFNYYDGEQLLCLFGDNSTKFENYIVRSSSFLDNDRNYFTNFWCASLISVYLKTKSEQVLTIIEQFSMKCTLVSKKFYLWSWLLVAFLISGDQRCDAMIDRIFDYLDHMYTFVFFIVFRNNDKKVAGARIENVLFRQKFFAKAIAKLSTLIEGLKKLKIDIDDEQYKYVYKAYAALLHHVPENLFEVHFKQFSGELFNILKACSESDDIDFSLKLYNMTTTPCLHVYFDNLITLSTEMFNYKQTMTRRLTMLRILASIGQRLKIHELEPYRERVLSTAQRSLDDHKRLVRMKAAEVIVIWKVAHD